MLTSPCFCVFSPFRSTSLLGKMNEGMKTAVIGRSFFIRWSVSLFANGISLIGIVGQVAIRAIQGIGLLLSSLFLIPFSGGRSLLKRFVTQSFIDLTAIGRVGLAFFTNFLGLYFQNEPEALFYMAPSSILDDSLFDFSNEIEYRTQVFALAKKSFGFNHSEINQADERGRRPLCYVLTHETMSTEEKYAWIQRLLKIGAKTDYKDHEQLSPINKFFLIANGNLSMDVLKNLLLAGAPLNDVRSSIEKQIIKNAANQIVNQEIEKAFENAKERKLPIRTQLTPDLEAIFKQNEYKLIQRIISAKDFNALDCILTSYPRFDVDGFGHGDLCALSYLFIIGLKNEDICWVNRLIAAGAKLDRSSTLPIHSLFLHQRAHPLFASILRDLLKAGSPRTWPSISAADQNLINEAARQVLYNELADGMRAAAAPLDLILEYS